MKKAYEEAIEKSIWQVLRTLYNDYDFELLIQSIRKKYGYERGELFERLNITAGEAGKREKRTYLLWVQLLYFVYHIPFDKFGIAKDEIYDPHFQDVSHLIWLRTVDDTNDEGNKFKAAYTNTFTVPLQSLEKKLWVYDYLGKVNPKELDYLHAYLEVHNNLYLSIEAKLDTCPGFEYIRFLALPFGISIDPSPVLKRTKYLNDVILALQYCSLPLVHHISRCLKNSPDLHQDIKGQGGFYLVAFPTRAYHYAVLDAGKFIMSEYYRYDIEGNSKPDLLFLESENPITRTLTKTYEWEKNKLLKTPHKKPKLTPTILRKAAELLLHDAQKERKDREIELQENPDNDMASSNLEYAQRLENDAAHKLHILEQIIPSPDKEM